MKKVTWLIIGLFVLVIGVTGCKETAPSVDESQNPDEEQVQDNPDYTDEEETEDNAPEDEIIDEDIVFDVTGTKLDTNSPLHLFNMTTSTARNIIVRKYESFWDRNI